MQLLITQLGREDFIFGLPWFKKNNPSINWTTGEVDIKKLTIATRLAQSSVKKDERSLEEKIPQAYHAFLNIFDEQKSQRLPPSRPYDHAIHLKPDFIPKKLQTISIIPPAETETR